MLKHFKAIYIRQPYTRAATRSSERFLFLGGRHFHTIELCLPPSKVKSQNAPKIKQISITIT